VSLLALEVESLRCLQQVQLELHPHVNLITGPNGAGKTSVLEAVYLLGRGRSFRTRHTEQLISHAAPGLSVLGRTDDESFPVLGLSFDRFSGLRVRLAGREARLLPGLATVVGALDDLPEPATRLRRVDAIRINGRAFEMIHLPAREVRAADVPLLALGVRGHHECALVRPNQ